MKKILSIAALSMLSLSSLLTTPAQAIGTSTATGTFNVNITLTSKCEINSAAGPTGAIIGNLAMAYESFGSAATGSTTFNVRCTNTLPFSLGLDTASVTDGITGLAYTLALATSSTASAVTPVDTLAGQTGTGSNVAYYVNGNIIAGLAGTSTAGADNKQRTLTITY